MKLFKSVIAKKLFFSSTPAMSKQNGKAFYAVAVGHNPGVYNTWPECKSQVDGVSNPKYKKFYTYAEAEQFVNEYKCKSQVTNKCSPWKSSTKECCDSDYSNWNQQEQQNPQYTGDKRLRKKSSLNYMPKSQLHRSLSAVNGCKNRNKSTRRFSTGSNNYIMYQKAVNKRNSADSGNKFQSYLNIGDDPFSISPPLRYFHMIFPDDNNESNVDFKPDRRTKFNRKAVDQDTKVEGELSITQQTKPPELRVSVGDRENCLNLPNVSKKGLTQALREEGVKIEKDTVLQNGVDRSDEVIIDEERSDQNEGTVKESAHFEVNTAERCEGDKEKALTGPTGTEPEASSSTVSPSGTTVSTSSVVATDYGTDLGMHMKTLVSDMGCKPLITYTLEKVVDMVAATLKQITSGIVAVISDTSTECAKTSVAYHGVPECRKSKLFSGEAKESGLTCSGCDSARESSNSNSLDLTVIKERLDGCETKIDLCFGQISTLVAGLTEAKNELRGLGQMIKNCTVKQSLSPGKQGVSLHSPGCSKRLGTKLIMTDQNSLNATKCRDGKILEKIDQDVKEFYEDLFDCSQTPSKRMRMSSPDPANSTANASSGMSKIKSEKADYVGFTVDEDEYVIVYTDGACIMNGRENPKAGIGIWFGDGHPMNVSKPLKGVPTNNNAEIQAARIAIELALSADISKLKIFTDSEFLINCATKWMERWKVKGWMTGANKPVKNREELEKLDRVMSQLSVRWEKVAAHCGIKGNEMADMLANKGAAFYVSN